VWYNTLQFRNSLGLPYIWNWYTLVTPPVSEWSIAISGMYAHVCLCVFVCLPACVSQKLHVHNWQNFLHMLSVAKLRTGGVVCCLLFVPKLFTTSCNNRCWQSLAKLFYILVIHCECQSAPGTLSKLPWDVRIISDRCCRPSAEK